MLNYLFQDISINTNNKARFVLLWFRLTQLIAKRKLSKVLFLPILLLYRVVIEWFMGTELNWNLKIGKLRLYHGQSLIINPNVIIGENCTLRCNTVIGNKIEGGGVPMIGNNVNIGANVVIIGDIIIGNNVTIGASSVVTKSVPENCLVIGNPGRIINAKKI